jgi:hypothetical protein
MTAETSATIVAHQPDKRTRAKVHPPPTMERSLSAHMSGFIQSKVAAVQIAQPSSLASFGHRFTLFILFLSIRFYPT